MKKRSVSPSQSLPRPSGSERAGKYQITRPLRPAELARARSRCPWSHGDRRCRLLGAEQGSWAKYAVKTLATPLD